MLAFEFATKLKKCPENWTEQKLAGKRWYYKFMNRHPRLTLRTPTQTSVNRIKAFCKENVDHFFQNLSNIFDRATFEPAAIYNMDETGFSTVPSKVGKIISLKGIRRVGMAAAERGTRSDSINMYIYSIVERLLMSVLSVKLGVIVGR